MYFEIDVKKYHLTFLKDTELYVFWHWTYALQCTHMYSSIGCYDEVNFTRELFRLLLLIYAVDPSYIENITCPIPELRCFWDKHFRRTQKLINEIASLVIFTKIVNSLINQIYSSLVALNGYDQSHSSVLGRALYSTIENVKIDATTYTDNIDDYVDNVINNSMKTINSISENSGELAYYRILSSISFYNLKYIRDKFDGNITLLRRDYLDGTPIEHFLQCDNKWFIDSFGGFFINCANERREYMHFNNKMLYLLWHIGIVLKKDSF